MNESRKNAVGKEQRPPPKIKQKSLLEIKYAMDKFSRWSGR